VQWPFVAAHDGADCDGALVTPLLDRRGANGYYAALETLAAVTATRDAVASLRPHLSLSAIAHA
jgi:hypothetical protein